MSLKNYWETLKWQTTVMRDPCDPIRDFRERMVALFSDDEASNENAERK